MPNSKANEIAVVGAGIVGVSTAIWLQRDGHSVTLIDRLGPGEGTSHGNAGVLASNSIVPVTTPGLWKKAPGMLLDPDGPLFLKWSYLPRMLPWLVKYMRSCKPDEVRRIASAIAGVVGNSLVEHQQLSRGTKAERWITPSDYVFAYRNRAHFEQDKFGWALRKANGYSWEELEGDAFHAYDATFKSTADFGVRCPDNGHIKDPGRYVKDLATHFTEQGGTLRIAEVQDVACDGDKVAGVLTDQGRIDCDRVVIATGAWSKPLAKILGVDVPLESERGYHMEFYEPSVVPRAPTMVAAGKFVLTPMDGRLRLAGLVEFGGLEAPPREAAFELLERSLRKAIPGITWGETKKWMGHRPAPTDSIPVIGEVQGTKGAYLGFGHHHIGLTAGPKTGRLIADMIAGRTANMDLGPYSPSRFS